MMQRVLRVVAGRVVQSHSVHVLVQVHLVVVEGGRVLEMRESRLRLRFDVKRIEGGGGGAGGILGVSSLVRLVSQVMVWVVVGMHSNSSGRGNHLVALLRQLAVLGASVLEPDLHLSLREFQGVREFRLPADRDVAGRVVLLLELHSLVVVVDDAVFVLGPCFACGREEKGEFVVKIQSKWRRNQRETIFANDPRGTGRGRSDKLSFHFVVLSPTL